jgi:hypothetical protein
MSNYKTNYNVFLQIMSDNIEYSNPMHISNITSFGNEFIEQSDIIFPISHNMENTFIDVSWEGEPFKQYICLKGPINENHDYSDFGFINSKNIYSFKRIFSKSLFYTKFFDTTYTNNHPNYDLYLYDIETRSSINMKLASHYFKPLDSNF